MSVSLLMNPDGVNADPNESGIGTPFLNYCICPHFSEYTLSAYTVFGE